MKIKIVPERCISCGLCHIKSPSTFDYHDNGIVKFYTTEALEEEFPDTAENLQAVKSCPTAALQLVKEQR
ncbi:MULTISPECIES: ferredoxin [unclassified Lactococcus]|uniref:ferredoxin n=1 Tax=unclassified Lactococcus TaxID=2643510 RepID=UPI0011CBF082|nr:MULTISPECIES: ferredoxin [unclassified Lactococcus]MQW22477.1 ferredoxin [Lactococcus sp. dk101]TXK45504.1 ferredoxin [Lactococcus sp. dk310]TXK51837.1 ferredoxin [Lactococcus sp. dk322]